MLTKKDRQQLTQDFKQVFTTKDDLEVVKKDIQVVKTHNQRIENKLDDMKADFETNLKESNSKLFTRIDSAMSTLEKTDQENTILKSRHPQRSKLLERVKKIEQHFGINTVIS